MNWKLWHRIAGVGLFTVSAIGGSVIACGDDSTANPRPDSGMVAEAGDASPAGGNGSLKGTVSYQGVKRNQAVYLVLFATLPPDPAKIGGATAIPMPMLPGTNAFTIKDVKPGTYYLAAEILPLVMGPPPPPETDTPTSTILPVTVAAGQEVTVPDVVLTDPMLDAGTDAKDDAMDGGDSG